MAQNAGVFNIKKGGHIGSPLHETILILQSHLRADFFEIFAELWLVLENGQEDFAGVIVAVGAIFDTARPGAFTDYAVGAFGKNPAVVETTVAIGNILGRVIHAVLLDTNPRDLDSLGLAFDRVIDTRGDVNRAFFADQTAIRGLFIHDLLLADTCGRPPQPPRQGRFQLVQRAFGTIHFSKKGLFLFPEASPLRGISLWSRSVEHNHHRHCRRHCRYLTISIHTGPVIAPHEPSLTWQTQSHTRTLNATDISKGRLGT